jgi:transcriptional regulator with XRE-family HTH domain
MNADQTRKLLELTAECGIPLQHAVGLLFRTRRLALGAFAKRVGSQRTTLYQALAGERRPSPEMRASLQEELGVDPWAIYASASDTSSETG